MFPSNEDLFYESIIKEWQESYGYDHATEDDVNEFFTDWFYQVDDENELEALNQAESYIRKRLGLES